jgi:hypothetical protein
VASLAGRAAPSWAATAKLSSAIHLATVMQGCDAVLAQGPHLELSTVTFVADIRAELDVWRLGVPAG